MIFARPCGQDNQDRGILKTVVSEEGEGAIGLLMKTLQSEKL